MPIGGIQSQSTLNVNSNAFVPTSKAVAGYAGTAVAHAALTNNPHSVTKTQVSLGNVADLKVKLDGTAAPTVNDDTTEGYAVGSRWIDVTNDKEYVCLDATDGAAVWKATAPSGAAGAVGTSGTPVDNDFAKFTDASTIEGRSYSEARQDLSNYVVYPQDYATGSGTAGSPWANSCIESAYTACPTGGTIFLRAGYYQLNGALTLAKAINIIGEGIGKSFIVTADAHGFTADSTNYITIKNLTMDGDAQTDNDYKCPIRLATCDYSTIENVEVKNGGRIGIDLYDSSYTSVKNVYLHDNYTAAIHPGAAHAGRNKYNTYDGVYCWNNLTIGFDEGAQDYYGSNNIYNNIRCWDNGSQGIAITWVENSILSNSSAYSNTGNGIYIYYCNNLNVHNCISDCNTLFGLNLSALGNCNFTNMIIINNNAGDTSNSGIYLNNSANVRFVSCQSYDKRVVVDNDIAFVDGGVGEDTITQVSGRFLTSGLVAGKTITITGATQGGNNSTFTIISVVAGTINVATGSLTTEAAGATVTITGQKQQDYGFWTAGTTDDVELINCELRGNKHGRFSNSASSTIKGIDVHTLIEDHDYTGRWETAKVGESVVFGELLYFNWTDKEWKKTDADAAATMPGLRIALEGKADGAECLMLVQGDIRDDSAFAFAGSIVYASCTPGDITSTAPSGSGDQVQRVGVAAHADYFYFNPDIYMNVIP